MKHEIKTLMSFLQKTNKINKNTYLIGDKGYIMDKTKIENKFITLIVPKRRNQKIKTTEFGYDKKKN